MNVLEEAHKLVHGDRHEDYGHPIHDFECVAAIATAILRRQGKLVDGAVVTARDWALFMQGCKISREAHKPKPDNRIDGAGYWETLQMVDEIEQST